MNDSLHPGCLEIDARDAGKDIDPLRWHAHLDHLSGNLEIPLRDGERGVTGAPNSTNACQTRSALSGAG